MGMKFFHLPKGKQFHIPYRFYDPRKEERDEREARIKAELGIDKDDHEKSSGYRGSIKGSFRSGLKSSSFARQERTKSNIRLLLILAALALLAYLFFK
jgi:hypothetical protein